MAGINAIDLTPSQRKAQRHIQNFEALKKFAKECDNTELDSDPWRGKVWIRDCFKDNRIRFIVGNLDPDNVKLTLLEKEFYNTGKIGEEAMKYRLKNGVLTIAKEKAVKLPAERQLGTNGKWVSTHGYDELILESETLTIDINKGEFKH